MTFKQFVESQEGRARIAYPDASGHSIGIGHFLTTLEMKTGLIALPDDGLIDWRQGLSDERIDKLFWVDLNNIRAEMEHYIRVPLTRNQWYALIDFVFNEGIGHFASSTVCKLVNRGMTDERIHEELKKWNLSQGKVLDALTERRELEWQIWSGKLVLE